MTPGKKRKARKAVDRPAAAVRKTARRYGVKAIELLWTIASGAGSESARIAAIKEILDRGYGRESRLTAEAGEAMIRRIERIIVDPSSRNVPPAAGNAGRSWASHRALPADGGTGLSRPWL